MVPDAASASPPLAALTGLTQRLARNIAMGISLWVAERHLSRAVRA